MAEQLTFGHPALSGPMLRRVQSGSSLRERTRAGTRAAMRPTRKPLAN